MTARRLLKLFLLAAVVAVPIEAMSFAAGKLLARWSLLYDPPAVERYGEYMRNRDPLLGWPGRAALAEAEFDAGGSRITPKFPDPATPSCVALFGDSFTWGHEASAENAYGNVLSGLMNCRVANYGVPAYGTDQAYLRYARVITDNAPIVILGHYSGDIHRNVSQEQGFLTNQVLGLKPRFVLEGDQLKLVELPSLSEAQYAALRTRARELLPYDYFAPGGPSGVRTLAFPFALSVMGAWQHFRVQAALKGEPSYEPFYDPRHPSHALQVTEAIIKAFASDAQRRRQKFMVLLIPDHKDLAALRERRALPYAELAERLRSAGIVVPRVAEQLEADLGGRDSREYYTRGGDGHFTTSGYRRLAEIAYAELREAGWVPAPRP